MSSASDRQRNGVVSSDLGHGFAINILQRQTDPDPILAEYLEQITPETEQRLGARANLRFGPATIFPNLSFFMAAETNRTIRLWHPRGPGKTETWSWTVADKDAPPEVKDLTRLGTQLGQAGPGALFEQDDGENWSMCTESSMGVIAKRYPMHYGMSLGQERQSEDYPGAIGPRVSEHNQRGLYNRWAEMMAADSWADIRK
jgi:hypothetical protein